MKILVVEDDNTIRNVLKISLESQSYNVDEAEDGQTALYMAKVNKYDLILLDLIIPKKSGLEVCKELRNENITTPIMMLTSKNETLTKVELLNSGADDYVTKPFSFEELNARICALWRRPKQTRSEIIKIGSLTIDNQKQEVVLKKKRLYLTRKEFSLLELLSKNPNKVVSRASIMEHVWNTDANPFSNTIETHVRNLRRKIQDSKREIIQSVPGRGYKMCTEKNLSAAQV
jgi:DNA-binding response OmpR family regulator